MSLALIGTILTALIQYGPMVVQIIQEGVDVEQSINKAAPDLLPNIAKLIESMFGVSNGSAVVSNMLLHLSGTTPTIPGYLPDGSIGQIPNPDVKQ